jgi:hypothetical protein
MLRDEFLSVIEAEVLLGALNEIRRRTLSHFGEEDIPKPSSLAARQPIAETFATGLQCTREAQRSL